MLTPWSSADETRGAEQRMGHDRRPFGDESVYNNFPWPSPDAKQRKKIEAAAQKMLDARDSFASASFAGLYDPNTMPAPLVKAHQEVDRAVDAAYGRKFSSESERMSYLFKLYQSLTAPVAATPKSPSRKARRKAEKAAVS